MLRELHISNLAVIEDATIEFAPGLNVFTGQTGAGKSLVIGAFELLLGLRTAGQMLRPGREEGRVSGVFELHDAAMVEQAGAAVDQALDPGEPVLVTRKLFASGRSSVSVNGQPATTAMVRQLGQLLVDIHGQHDHQFLLRPANQLAILDAFADCQALRERFGERLRELRELQGKQAELSTSGALRRQQLELYEFQAQEIDEVGPTAGEFPELQARHQVLANLQRIKREAGQAHAGLYEAEGSVVERLQMIVHLLGDLSELDEQLEPIVEQVRESTLSLQEGAFELGRYVERLEHDPGELGDVEGRLNELNRLVQKYGEGVRGAEDPVEAVLTYREQIGRQIEELRGADEGLAQMEQRMGALREELREVGEALSAQRREAAEGLRPLVEAELGALGMGEARFDVLFESGSVEEDEALGPTGLDAIELAVQTNPGQTLQPLRKIASGGELSRVMLALKSILAGSDRISVLVFDEIDANIGGRLGSVIGQKLRELAMGGKGRAGKSVKGRGGKGGKRKKAGQANRHQVLCITHLPQIAAFADRHLRIAKQVAGKGRQRETRTTVSSLSESERVEELAEMMAGTEATATTRQQAKELLAAAE